MRSITGMGLKAALNCLPAAALALLLAACSAGDTQQGALEAADSSNDQAGPAAELASALPEIPVEPRAASVTALDTLGKDYYDSSPGVQVSGDRLVLASSSGVLRWSLYRFTSTETAKYPVELRVEAGEGSDPYWLAIADFESGRWQFSGPFNGNGSLAVPQGGDYLSPGGYAYAAAITFDGDRAVIAALQLVLSQYPPPPPPTGLSATVLPGSVRLDWDQVDSPGVVGYNVYFALSPFELAEQFHVGHANLELVADSAEPSFSVLELEADTSYWFRVAAVVGDQVESLLSNQVTTSTSYTLHADDVFPQRQYPGFWVFVEGSGFDPAPGSTTVSLNSSPINSADVKVVDANLLRFRVPKNRPTGESVSVRVHTGTSASNVIPLFITNYSTPPKAFAHVGRLLYEQYQCYEPYGTAVDPDGRVWIVAAQARRLDGYNADGSPYKTVNMNDLRDVEALPDGRLLCKESNGPHVFYYTPDTGLITRAIDDAVVDPVLGSGEWLATNGTGTIYLSDAENGLVHKFINGAFSISIGEGILSSPRDVELDGSGNLVVADRELDCIFWFSPNGTQLGSYDGSFDSEDNDGELRDPHGMTLAGNMLYVVDRERDRVLRFNNSNRGFVDEWGNAGYQGGGGSGLPDPAGEHAYFWSLWGIAADSDGNVVVSDNFNMRAGRYRGSDGLFLHGFGDYVAKPGEFIYPRSLAVREEDGAYAVLDRASFSISLFDRKNQLTDDVYLETEGGQQGDIATGRMGRHGEGICWSSNGRLYFTHAYNKLTEYTDDFSAYRLLAYDWGEEPAEFKGAYSICEYGGDLFVSDRDNARIQIFSGIGQYERSIEMPDPVNQRPDRVAYDSDNGWLYVLDRAWNNQSIVHRFDAASGELLDSLDPGYGMGAALAVDPVGHIYVYHSAEGFQLERWSPPASPGGQYTLVDRFLDWGDGDGEIRNISWLTISSDGRYFICDPDRQQVVILAP